MLHPHIFGRYDLLTPYWDEKKREALEREKYQEARELEERLKARCNPNLFRWSTILTLS